MTADHDLVQHVAAFVDAFNSGDPVAVDRLYDEQAVLVPVPGIR